MRPWICGLIAMLSVGARGQEISVRALLTDDRPYVDTSVQYVIQVNGAHSAVAPDLPEIPLVTWRHKLVQRETGSEMVRVDGQLRRVTVERQNLYYEIIPHAPGRHTIPSVELTVGGKIHRTNEIPFVAKRPDSSGSTRVRLETERDRVYVGEPVPVRLMWYTDTVRGARLEGAVPQEQARLISPQRPRWERESRGYRSQRMKFHNLDFVAGIRDNGVSNGKFFDYVLTLDMIVIPQRAGELTVGPITIEYERQTGQFRTRSREFARSNGLQLEVLEVPKAAAPETFDGLVGVASANAKVDTRRAKVGDPIVLEYAILADEPVERVGPAVLAAQGPAWDSFQLDPTGWQEVGSSPTARLFQTTIRARDESVHQIPPIELAFFDPATERFAFATTQQIPVIIEPTVTISSVDVLGATLETQDADGEPLQLRDLHAGVLDNAKGSDLLNDESAHVLALVRSPVGVGVIVLPPVAYAATALVLGVRGAQADARAPEKEGAARARTALEGAGPEAQRVREAIRLYIGERFGRELETITPKDCEDLLASEGDDASGAGLSALLIQAERERFDEVPAPAPPPIDRAREALDRAERSEA